MCVTVHSFAYIRWSESTRWKRRKRNKVELHVHEIDNTNLNL